MRHLYTAYIGAMGGGFGAIAAHHFILGLLGLALFIRVARHP